MDLLKNLKMLFSNFDFVIIYIIHKVCVEKIHKAKIKKWKNNGFIKMCSA